MRPFSALTKHFTPERRARIEELKDTLRDEMAHKAERVVLSAKSFDALLERLKRAGGFDPKVARVLTTPSPWDEDMCPNCVTPWKCNGPHIPRGWGRRLPSLYNRLHAAGLIR